MLEPTRSMRLRCPCMPSTWALGSDLAQAVTSPLLDRASRRCPMNSRLLPVCCFVGAWLGSSAPVWPEAVTVKEEAKPRAESPVPVGEPSDYTYQSAARRDPFADLTRLGHTGPFTRCRCGGLPGFLIQEVALRGIVKTRKGLTAMIEAPDRKSYFVVAGERFFDGVVLTVEESGVMIRQDVTDPLAAAKTREFRVSLHSTEAALAPR